MGFYMQVLVCVDGEKWHPQCAQVRDEEGIRLLRLSTESRPAVFVIAAPDAARYLEMDETVQDRGTSSYRLAQKLFRKDDRPVLVRTHYTTWKLSMNGILALLKQARKQEKMGPFIVAVPPEHFSHLQAEDAEAEPITPANASLEDRLLAEPVPQDLVDAYVGCSRPYRLVRSQVMVAARTEDPILITGETGTGKEVVARAIHQHSVRAKESFVAVNCAAIPSTLLESELFGYEKGAHSQAYTNRPGFWMSAHKGTLFLDEIGDLALESQAKILRALQEGKVRPVGADDEREADVRILAATHRDLFGMVQDGRFRQDLFYRLLCLRIETPPLADSPSDLALIAESLWSKICGSARASLSDDVLRLLQTCPWAGNVRELNAVLGYAHNIVGNGPVSRELMESVMERFPRGDLADGQDPEGDARRHHSRCLRQLCRLARALRACQVTCRPLGQDAACGGQVLSTMCLELNRQLPILDGLSENPALLWDPGLPSMVDLVCDAVARVIRATPLAEKACRREWQEVLAPVLRNAIAKTMRETRSLAGGGD